LIDTAAMSDRLRAASVDRDGRRLLVTKFAESRQADDLSEPVNCDGLGRVRHFRRATSAGWPENPLPIDPASHALGIEPSDMMRAQVFQNAACNWRCWYCYVPFELLAANPDHGRWVTAGELLDLFADLPDRPNIVDLSGGQPDLVPEWTAWMAAELAARNLDGVVYLWVDDNLSTDIYWTALSEDERATIASYRSFGRVGCFKGYDKASFAFNTGAEPDLFDRQFEIMERHVRDGTDCYGYATFTSPTTADPSLGMADFVDRLQAIHPLLPLRVIPLEIEVWGPVQPRMRASHELSLRHQGDAVAAWQSELVRRFSEQERAARITSHDLRRP
jgi:uncharacterized Fe-S cluster-containing radical SAM superfamily protein